MNWSWFSFICGILAYPVFAILIPVGVQKLKEIITKA